MADIKQTLQATLNKQRQAIEAQKAESERIQKEREQASQDGTAQPFPSPLPPPSK